MSRFVFRPLFIFITVFAVCVAVLQAGGRVLMLFSAQLEPLINATLASKNVSIEGVYGDWRLLNPVIRVASVHFPGGSAKNLEIEVDFVESLVRGHLIARRVNLKRGVLGVLRDENGRFYVPGLPEPSADFDWQTAWKKYVQPFVTHSDEFNIDFRVAFADAGTEKFLGEFHLDLQNLNHGGEHRGLFILSGTENSKLEFSYSARDEVWSLGKSKLRMRLHGEIQIPDELLNKLQLANLGTGPIKGFWRADDGRGGGELEFTMRPSTIMGGNFQATSMLLHAQQIGQHEDVYGVITDTTVFGIPFPEVVWQFDLDSTALELWISELDLAEVLAPLTPQLAGIERVGPWFTALNIRGKVHNLRARVADGLHYSASVSDVALESFRGVPMVRKGAGELIGINRLVQMQVNADDMTLAFPEIFPQSWHIVHVTGPLTAWGEQGYFGLNGSNLHIETDFGRASGVFSISAPKDKSEQRLALLLKGDQAAFEFGRTFIPRRLSPNLRAWLNNSISAGDATNIDVAFHGHTQKGMTQKDRRLEFVADFSGGAVQYHPRWPEVTEAAGRLELTGEEIRIYATGAQSAGARLGASTVIIDIGGNFANLETVGQMDAGEGLAFVRNSQLHDWLPMVTEDWTGTGVVNFSGTARIPLKNPATNATVRVRNVEQYRDQLDVALDLQFQQVDLNFADMRIGFDALEGSAHYEFPYTVKVDQMKGLFFGHDTTINVSNMGDQINFQFDGQGSVADVYRVLDQENLKFASGSTHFEAVLSILPGVERGVRLNLQSDLIGIALDLPSEFDKAPATPRTTQVDVAFGEDGDTIKMIHGDRLLNGWIDLHEGRVTRGSVGVNAPNLHVTNDANILLVTGSLEKLTLGESQGAGVAFAEDIPWRLDNFKLGALEIGVIKFEDLRLQGVQREDAQQIEISGETVEALVTLPNNTPLIIEIEKLNLFTNSSSSEATEELLADLSDLPDVDVFLDNFYLDDDDFGRWMFKIRNLQDRITFTDVDADIKGLHINSPEGSYWLKADQRTFFNGELSGTDVGEVLVAWGYAPSLISETIHMNGELNWPGAPQDIAFDELTGKLDLDISEGRFVDVQTGGATLRIFSLLNFSAIAKRMSFNFSDVLGKGVSFNTLSASPTLQDGVMKFSKSEPMRVDGTGSSFKISGTVDLGSGALDNEMIVTLPVSKTLPWYGVYVGLANPVAGFAVLLGERIFRVPLQKFTSARYQISGDLETPEVKLVGVFSDKMTEEAVPEKLPVKASEKLDVEQDIVKEVMDINLPGEPDNG